MNSAAREPLTNARWRTFVGRALRGRCPRCGKGELRVSRFKLAERCTNCDLVYRREQGAMTGQLYLASVITQLFAAVLIGIVFIFTDWEASTSIPLALAILALFSWWMLPKSMGLWVAIEFMTDVGNRETWALEYSERESEG